MEYTTVYCEWNDNKRNESVESRLHYKREYEDNMVRFENLVQEALDEGWQPLGAPTFSKRWLKETTFGGIAIQTLIRDKHQEKKTKMSDKEKEKEKEREKGKPAKEPRRSSRISIAL
jgi:hypothetical protein